MSAPTPTTTPISLLFNMVVLLLRWAINLQPLGEPWRSLFLILVPCLILSRAALAFVRFSQFLPSAFLAPQNIGIDRENDDETCHHDLPFLSDRHDAQAVGQHTHDERADDRPQDRARTAAERRPANDHGGYRFEFITLAESRLGRIQARGDQQPRDAANGPAQAVNGDLPPIHIHAGDRKSTRL